MSEVLTVPTAFGDISDLTEGLVDRVDGEQIILYGPNPYDEGAELDFSVLLLDGTPALEGRGRVEASVDGGEDRDPSTRFDIILGALELGGVAEAVFERMLIARSSMLAGEEAPAEEAYAEEAAPEEAHAEEAPVEEAPAADADAAAEDVPVEDEPAEEAEAAPAEEAEAAAEEAPTEEAYAEAPSDDEAHDEAAFEAAEAAEDVAAPAPAEEEGWGADEGAFDDEATVVTESAYAEEAPVEEAPVADADAAYAEEAEGDEAIDEEPAPPVSPAIAIPTELFPADDAFRGAAPPAPPEDPGGFGVTNDLTEGLVRPVQQNTWTPVAPERPEPRPSSGLFQYGASVPLPDAPPRPDLDPSLVVTRAPHPGAGEVVEAAAPEYAEVADYAEVEGESGEYEASSAGEDSIDDSIEAPVEADEVEADVEADEVEADVEADDELELELEASERD
jgi:hypothetical protein